MALLGAPARAETPAVDPIETALRNIEAVDGTGRWFSYSIAMVGAAGGLGLGAWALDRRPIAVDGEPDPITFGASLALVGTAACQLIHGVMRFDERGISATTARALIDDPKMRAAAGRLFLTHRAAEARSTRLWGGVMTTVQGAATVALGVRLWTEGSDGLDTTGIVLTGLGVVNTLIGAVHFLGKPRAERELDAAVSASKTVSEIRLAPSVMDTGSGVWVPGVFGTGRF